MPILQGIFGSESTNATGVFPATTSTLDEYGIGTTRWNADGTKLYKWVQYVAGAGPSDTPVAGHVVYYYAPGGDFATTTGTYKVTTDLSDSAETGAGVLQGTPTTLYYLWVQIKGLATLTIALTAGSDGDPLCPTGTTDGTLDVAAAVTDHVCAYAEDISAKTIMCDFPL